MSRNVSTPSFAGLRSRQGARRLGLAALSAAVGAFAPAAFAAGTATYVGSAANTNWDDTSNWSGGTLPLAGDDIVISDTTAQSTLTLNDGSHAIGLLQYGSTGTRVSGTSSAQAFQVSAGGNLTRVLTINTGITANGTNAAINLLIAAPITVAAPQTWTVGGSSATAPATNGAGSALSDQGLSISNANNGTNAVALTLGGKLTKAGIGQLLIIGRTVGDGDIDVNAGALKLNAGNSTQLTVGGTGTITVNSGASLFVSKNSGTFNLTKAIKVNAGGTLSVGGNLGNGSYNIDSPIAWSGGTTLNTNPGAANQVVNFTGAMTGTGTITTSVSSTNTGRVVLLSGDNSGLSATILNKTVLAIGSATALGTGVYRADTGSTLQSSDGTARTINNVVDLAASTTFGSATTGELIFSSTGSNGALIGIAAGGQPKTITVANARTTISGTITDTGGGNAITKAGTGILVFSGANLYTRPTAVTVGTLQVVSGGRIGSPSGTNTVTIGDAGLLQLDVAGIADGANLDVTSTDSIAEVALASGVVDTINGLILNGVPVQPGTYGSSTSGAANTGLANPDDFFSGPGTLNVTNLAVVPEPGTLGLAGIAIGGLLAGRRRRR